MFKLFMLTIGVPALAGYVSGRAYVSGGWKTKIVSVLLMALVIWTCAEARAEDRNVQLLRESVSECVTIYQTCVYDGYYTPEQCLDGVPDEIRGLDQCCDEKAAQLGFKKKERK